MSKLTTWLRVLGSFLQHKYSDTVLSLYNNRNV